ncbi:MAG: hypothetical protein HY644_02790 [Acidobacteria bacterium]|nr:hypothetical protein [Acidobacteriota bacterium]
MLESLFPHSQHVESVGLRGRNGFGDLELRSRTPAINPLEGVQDATKTESGLLKLDSKAGRTASARSTG